MCVCVCVQTEICEVIRSEPLDVFLNIKCVRYLHTEVVPHVSVVGIS